MKFKTNARCQGCATTILGVVRSKFPNAEWSMNLDDADKVLEVHGLPEDSEHAQQVENAIKETGFQGSWLRPEGC